ncbi:pancreatic lipase-related protein 2 precursor [Xenopus laevis]|uniref:Triacylglycerol lipase n=1 Tax=Xenopus laevis TaxID=8355 RepID=Q6PAD5_XENLA|nr:pancreatic lipase-related protein 2 precursor [Xenopus laevis]AAH60360.1 MGC68755 protein [Xenopus laevis]
MLSADIPLCQLLILIILHGIFGTVKGKEICYEPFGCFSDKQPWSRTKERPFAALPWTPESINTRFFLNTRRNPNQHQIISAQNITSIEASAFQTNQTTCFIVHGMGERAENNWVSQMCKAILQVEDVNCIGVDWRNGSGNIQMYVQAANNIRVVGAEIALLLQVLQKELGYPASKVHVIGHSLGAHAAGEAGRRHEGIWRITGLDPARQFFEDTPPEVRLDPSDATFVDVIHTDISSPLGAGIAKPIGHLDFYPNGGKQMTGCPAKLSFLGNFNALFDTMTCSHFRAFQYYTESLRSPGGFLGYPCESYDSFLSGSCFPCPEGRCSLMGHFSRLPSALTATPQTFYLNTGGNISHFSNWRYKVSVTLGGTKTFKGKFYVILSATGGDPQQYEVVSKSLIPGNNFSGFIDVGFELGPLDDVTCKWEPAFLNIFHDQFGAQRLEIQSGKDGKVSTFCGKGTVSENVLQKLIPC